MRNSVNETQKLLARNLSLLKMSAEASPRSVSSVLARAVTRLQPLASAILDAQVLLGHALGRSRSELMIRSEEPVSAAELTRFEQLVKRRAGGEPLAYILGRREFWSLDLKVSPAVLVPRPETELVVERCLALCRAENAEVADLGTGSGAIALALAWERRLWRLTATDRSEAALAVASANARALSIGNVRFVLGEWFRPLDGLQFDLIASNPPYVAIADSALSDPALRHEPLVALASGPSGIEDLAALIGNATAHLLKAGWLVLEHAPGQARDIAELLVAQGFRHVRCHADLAGLERVTEAQRP
jgi:release factor glutamine methyltransferase